jgi:hypothetical protein
MAATILDFPIRSIRVQHERGGEAWCVVTPKGHAWLHGDFHAAMLDAQEVASGFGVTVRSSTS